jgi:hypothetical protein
VRRGIDGITDSNKAARVLAVMWETPSSASRRRMRDNASLKPLNSIGASTFIQKKLILKFAAATVTSFGTDKNAALNLLIDAMVDPQRGALKNCTG